MEVVDLVTLFGLVEGEQAEVEVLVELAEFSEAEVLPLEEAEMVTLFEHFDVDVRALQVERVVQVEKVACYSVVDFYSDCKAFVGSHKVTLFFQSFL